MGETQDERINKFTVSQGVVSVLGRCGADEWTLSWRVQCWGAEGTWFRRRPWGGEWNEVRVSAVRLRGGGGGTKQTEGTVSTRPGGRDLPHGIEERHGS